jgi:hypothetical protein
MKTVRQRNLETHTRGQRQHCLALKVGLRRKIVKEGRQQSAHVRSCAAAEWQHQHRLSLTVGDAWTVKKDNNRQRTERHAGQRQHRRAAHEQVGLRMNN